MNGLNKFFVKGKMAGGFDMGLSPLGGTKPQQDARINILKPIYGISKNIGTIKDMNQKITMSDNLLSEIAKAKQSLMDTYGMSEDDAFDWAVGISKMGIADAEGRTVDLPQLQDFDKIYNELK